MGFLFYIGTGQAACFIIGYPKTIIQPRDPSKSPTFRPLRQKWYYSIFVGFLDNSYESFPRGFQVSIPSFFGVRGVSSSKTFCSAVLKNASHLGRGSEIRLMWSLLRLPRLYFFAVYTAAVE